MLQRWRYSLANDGDTHAMDFLLRSAADRNSDGETPLHVAATLGFTNVVESLLNGGANLTASDNYGSTPLHLAAQHGQKAVVTTLLERGADVDINKIDDDGDTVLHSAAFCGQKSIVEAIVLASCNLEILINKGNNEGRTPLHYAAGKGNLDAVFVLINHGAKKNVHDAYGATPFHFAARDGKMDVMEVVLDDISGKSLPGCTALHYAAWNGRTEAVKWLLDKGAAVGDQDENGDTPLHFAARKGSRDAIEALINGGAQVCASNSKGELPFGLAEDRVEDHESRKEAIQALLSLSSLQDAQDTVDVRAEHRNGATILHYAAGYGSGKVIEWLLGLRGSPNVHERDNVNLLNSRDKKGNTPLHWAAIKGNKEGVKVLVEKRSDVNSKNGLNQTPLFLALLHGQEDAVGELLSQKAEIPENPHALLEECCKKHWRDIDKYFRKSTGDSVSLLPPVYLALHGEREDIAKFIRRHYKVKMQDPLNEKGQYKGYTALHWATILGKTNIVSQLCRDNKYKQQLTANVEDDSGKTALQHAYELGHKEIEKELQERDDVRAHVESLYRDRQVYVDAANAILVGAALIASVTFAGWLQPPLNYTSYYNLPYLEFPAPPGTSQNYAAVQQHLSVQTFWVFNSLSFFFAIATVLAGAGGVLPMPDMYIKTAVRNVRRALVLAAVLLVLSIAFVLAAFTAAGFAALPPIFKYQANMMGTVLVGGIVCVGVMAWFLRQLYHLRPGWWRAIELKQSKLWKRLFQKDSASSDASIFEIRDEKESASGSDTRPIDDYQVGSTYPYCPWEDGLNRSRVSPVMTELEAQAMTELGAPVMAQVLEFTEVEVAETEEVKLT